MHVGEMGQGGVVPAAGSRLTALSAVATPAQIAASTAARTDGITQHPICAT